jgi:hypothetical protein
MRGLCLSYTILSAYFRFIAVINRNPATPGGGRLRPVLQRSRFIDAQSAIRPAFFHPAPVNSYSRSFFVYSGIYPHHPHTYPQFKSRFFHAFWQFSTLCTLNTRVRQWKTMARLINVFPLVYKNGKTVKTRFLQATQSKQRFLIVC